VRHHAAPSCGSPYLEEGARLIDLAHSTQNLFAKQEPHEQRRLLNFVLSNSVWKDGELSVTSRQLFDCRSNYDRLGHGKAAEPRYARASGLAGVRGYVSNFMRRAASRNSHDI
jgi:hypothetical protein